MNYQSNDKGLKNVFPYYKNIMRLYPLLSVVFKKHVSTLSEVGIAVISVMPRGWENVVQEVKDIVALARK